MKSINILLIAIVAVFSASFATPQSERLYGLAESGQKKVESSGLYIIDPSTAAISFVGDTGFPRCTGLDSHPFTNVLFGLCLANDFADVVLITVNPATGEGTLVGELDLSGINTDGIADISFRSDGTLFVYISAEPSDILGIIDTDTGALTQVGDTGLLFGFGGLAFSLADVLYFVGIEDLEILNSLYVLNQDNGDANLIRDLNLPPEMRLIVQSADTRPSSGELFMANRVGEFNVNLATLDVDSGNVNDIGQMSDLVVRAIAFTNPRVTNIPTLSQWGLIALSGVLMLLGAYYLRKKVSV